MKIIRAIVKTIKSDGPGFESWLWHLEMCDLGKPLPLYSRILSFLTCKVGITLNLLHEVIVRINWDNTGKAPDTESMIDKCEFSTWS